jgi:erythromycin esterase
MSTRRLFLDLAMFLTMVSGSADAASSHATRVLRPAQAADLSAPEAVVTELAQHASAWKTVDPGSALADLSPLKKIVGEAHVVSLGEAAYGTRELFGAERRVLEFLVSEMGFSVLAVEANWPETLAVDDYLLHGKGDPKAALAALRSLTWSTEEALDLVQWMRRWNADERHSKKLRFEGFDMQYTSVAYQRMHDYLVKVDEESAERVGLVLAAFRQADPSGRPRYASLSPELRDAARAAIQEVAALLEDSKEIYVKRSSESEWTTAKQCTVVLAEAEEMMRASSSLEARNVRDRCMAENIQWILGHSPRGDRIMVWAHNGRVREARDSSYIRMGAHLREKLGRDDVILGTAFGQGSFLVEPGADEKTPRTPQEMRVGAAPSDTVEAALARAKLPIAVFDLASLPKDGAAASWLTAPRLMREAETSLANEHAMLVAVEPKRAYDALLFVERTSAAHPIAKAEPKEK